MTLTSPVEPPAPLTRSITPSQAPQPSRLRNVGLPTGLVKSTSTSQLKERALQQWQVGSDFIAANLSRPLTASATGDKSITPTRTPSPGQSSSANGEAEYRPDLSREVALLSTKLVNAINHQTNLDDTLQATRLELEQSRLELARLRAEKKSVDDDMTTGVLVKQSEVEATFAQFRADLEQEKEKRVAAEKGKRQTDGELENLTSSLFEEANKMVAEARRDTEAIEKRNSQLRGRLNDSETLLASQQEQLQDLKQTMEALDRTSTNPRDSSVPSTPVNLHLATFEALQLAPRGAEPADVPPNHPLHFSHVLHPVLRSDVASYPDFAELITTGRKATQTHSRSTSGTIAGPGSTTTASANDTAPSTTFRTSTPSLPGAFSFSTSNSTATSPSSATFAPIPALKDTKFYKRILVEDLDPTLRLDLAPGLSFLSRRSVQSALLNGTLVVEPFAASSNWKLYAPVFPCSLCGESRKGDLYMRKYRFRTSEADDAQRYPLCDFCLARVRASGDFIGFLRVIKEGVWKCASEEEEKSAWEEAVRLRERMFWARLGGGVVPSSLLTGPGASKGSPLKTRARRGSEGSNGEKKKDGVEDGGDEEEEDDDVFHDSEVEARATAKAENENASLEAQAEELKRRTMRHMNDSPIVKTVAATTATPNPPLPLPLPSSSPSMFEPTRTTSQANQIEASEQLQRETAQQGAQEPRLAPIDSTSSSSNDLHLPDHDTSDPDDTVSADDHPDSDASGPPPPVPPHRDGLTSLPSPPPEASTSTSTPFSAMAIGGTERRDSDASLSLQLLNQTSLPQSSDGRRPSSVLMRVRDLEGKGWLK